MDYQTIKYLLTKKDTTVKLIQEVLFLEEFDMVIKDKKNAQKILWQITYLIWKRVPMKTHLFKNYSQ